MHRRSVLSGALLVAFAFALMPLLARAEVAPVIDLTPHARILDQGLHLWGSGGDAPQPAFNPVLGEALAGFGAALVSVPITEVVSVAMRNMSPNAYLTLAPILVLFLALPTIAVTFAEWGAGRALGADVRVQPAIYIAVAVQAVVFVGAFFLNVWLGNLEQAALFSLVEVILLPGTVTAVMNIQLGMRPKKKVVEADVPLTRPIVDRPMEHAAGGVTVARF